MVEDFQKPITRTSLVDNIVDRLRSEILQGRYQPGEALPPERQLASDYGVTRASLKNALVRLEQLGLIRTRHGVGSIVQDIDKTGGADLLKFLVGAARQPDAGIIEDLFEARAFVGGSFARLAAKRRTDEDLDILGACVATLEGADMTREEVQRAEYGFVRALARAARNRAFLFVANSLVTAYRLNERFYDAHYSDPPWIAENLRAVCEAVRSQDEEGARLAMEEYLSEQARRVLSRVRGSGAGGSNTGPPQ